MTSVCRERLGRCTGWNIILVLVCIVCVLLLLHQTDLESLTSIKHPENMPLAPQWTEIFSFLPLGCRYCEDLFQDRDKSKPYPPDFQKEMNKLQNKFEYVKGKYKVKSEGYSAQYLEEGMFYWELASRTSSFVSTICETGFNGGHSALNWLMANPQARLYSFDKGSHKYSFPMAQYLKDKFQTRFNVTWGDSVQTLPEFRRQNPSVKCDLIIIDGGHLYDVAYSDWINFRAMAGKNSIVLLDNYPDDQHMKQRIGQVWEEAKQRRQLGELFRCRFKPPQSQGFTIGFVIQ